MDMFTKETYLEKHTCNCSSSWMTTISVLSSQTEKLFKHLKNGISGYWESWDKNIAGLKLVWQKTCTTILIPGESLV